MNKLTQTPNNDQTEFKRPGCYSDCFSPAKQRIWDYIQARAPYEDELIINQTKLASILHTSRATVQHALKTFISCNLMKKTRERTGRGNGSIFRLLWSFNPKSETLTDNTTYYRPYPRKDLTKGSKNFAYSAMFFRKLLEKKPLGVSVKDAVGEIMTRLEGKRGQLAQDFYNELTQKDLGNLNKIEFFIWLSEALPPERRGVIEGENYKKNPENISDELKKYEENYAPDYNSYVRVDLPTTGG